MRRKEEEKKDKIWTHEHACKSRKPNNYFDTLLKIIELNFLQILCDISEHNPKKGMYKKEHLEMN